MPERLISPANYIDFRTAERIDIWSWSQDNNLMLLSLKQTETVNNHFVDSMQKHQIQLSNPVLGILHFPPGDTGSRKNLSSYDVLRYDSSVHWQLYNIWFAYSMIVNVSCCILCRMQLLWPRWRMCLQWNCCWATSQHQYSWRVWRWWSLHRLSGQLLLIFQQISSCSVFVSHIDCIFVILFCSVAWHFLYVLLISRIDLWFRHVLL